MYNNKIHLLFGIHKISVYVYVVRTGNSISIVDSLNLNRLIKKTTFKENNDQNFLNKFYHIFFSNNILKYGFLRFVSLKNKIVITNAYLIIKYARPFCRRNSFIQKECLTL